MEKRGIYLLLLYAKAKLIQKSLPQKHISAINATLFFSLF